MIPDHETVKQIMNEAYNGFYLKWRNNLTIDNADQMMQEVNELDEKYPYPLCRKILLELVEIIEDGFKKREA